MKKIKMNGKFFERQLSTCPTAPRFHAAFGEPSTSQPEFMDNDLLDLEEEFISKDALRLLNRVDSVELNLDRQEVFIKDDFNVYIIYEATLFDMQAIEEELLRVGSFFISRTEDLLDTEFDKVCHKKDRQETLRDLLLQERLFQFKKVELIEQLMECYEHICDPLEQ